MNSFANRFSTNTTQLPNPEEDNFSDATWGSEAGFGNIAMGVPTFSIPDVADVSDSYLIPFFFFAYLPEIYSPLPSYKCTQMTTPIQIAELKFSMELPPLLSVSKAVSLSR